MKLYQISQNDSFLLWRTHFVLGQFRNIHHWLFNVQLEHLLEQWHFPHSVCCLKSFDLNFSHFWNQIYHFLCHIRKWIMWNDIFIEIKSFEFSREEETLFFGHISMSWKNNECTSQQSTERVKVYPGILLVYFFLVADVHRKGFSSYNSFNLNFCSICVTLLHCHCLYQFSTLALILSFSRFHGFQVNLLFSAPKKNERINSCSSLVLR